MFRGEKLLYRSLLLALVAGVFVIYIIRLPFRYDSPGQEEKKKKYPVSRLNLDCESCALVGTAGTLLDSHQGQYIDSASCVFRMGFSPTEGLEDDVGKKTTARIVDSLRFTRFMQFPEKLQSTQFAADKWYIFDARPEDRDQYEQTFLDNVNGSWVSPIEQLAAYHKLRKLSGKPMYYDTRGKHSSFWFSVQLMEKSNCQSFAIYGVPDAKLCEREPNSDVKLQYWKKNKPVVLCHEGKDAASGFTDFHMPLMSPTVLEREAFREWSREKDVEFIRPTWPDL